MHHKQIIAYFEVFNQSKKIYSRQLEPVCRKWDLTRSEVDVLLFLYNNPQYDRAADIVAHRGMTKSHVSMSVTTLVERGMLERQYSQEDRRTAHLRLLEEGKTIAAEAKAAQQHFFSLIYEGITPEEMAQWEQVTRKVYDNIENLSNL